MWSQKTMSVILTIPAWVQLFHLFVVSVFPADWIIGLPKRGVVRARVLENGRSGSNR